MKFNPLIQAVSEYDVIIETQVAMMHDIGGDAVLDPWNEQLCQDIWMLTLNSWDATGVLSARARRARLNAIWADFVKKKREELCCVSLSLSTAPSPEMSEPLEPSTLPTTEKETKELDNTILL